MPINKEKSKYIVMFLNVLVYFGIGFFRTNQKLVIHWQLLVSFYNIMLNLELLVYSSLIMLEIKSHNNRIAFIKIY